MAATSSLPEMGSMKMCLFFLPDVVQAAVIAPLGLETQLNDKSHQVKKLETLSAMSQRYVEMMYVYWSWNELKKI
jgi:hypothetical protein